MTMSSNLECDNNNGRPKNLGETKVFVGGLAWETPMEAMKEHFDKFGEIVEAVIISNKLTGRSKGYGFVTFKDAEAAKKACEDATPMIHGRRANCNLASLGARRPRPTNPSTAPPPPLPVLRAAETAAAAVNRVQLFYPATALAAPPPPLPPVAGTGAPPFLHHPHNNHRQAVPLYGYPPTYVAADLSYNHKGSYGGGAYMNGAYMNGAHMNGAHMNGAQIYPAQHQHMMGANTFVAVYPYYHHTLGLPAHMYSPTMTGPFPTVPALLSKPVGNGEAMKRVVKGN